MTVLQVLCWSLLGLAAALLLRRGWLRLFGPVLFYDMVRQARRLRYFILRIGYAGLLLLITYLEGRRPFITHQVNLLLFAVLSQRFQEITHRR